MRRHLIGVIGIVLLVVGLLGVAAVAVVASLSRTTSPSTVPYGGMMGRGYPGNLATGTPGGTNLGYTTPGQQIYFTGIGHGGQLIPRQGGLGMMGAGGCANCHGPDGRGGRVAVMMGGGIEVPDIRYSTLTSPRSDEGTTEPAWTEAEIATAIRDGREPNGKSLKAYMPRWQMDDQDMADTIAYLKELK